MVVFWILATLMTLVALAVVLVPLLRARGEAGPTEHHATLEVLRGQRQEIEADIAAGTLPAEAREEALAELLARAGEDLPPEPAARPASASKPWLAAAAVAVIVPALAFGLYAAIGTPSASDPGTLKAAAGEPGHDQQLASMIETLAAKVRERPDDARGWELLARSLMTLGRFQDAADAYEHLAKLAPADAQVLADWADALGMAQARSLRGRPRELVERALSIDPNHAKALALAGTAAMDASEYPAAMGYWQRLAATLPPGSEDAAQLSAIMDEVRQRAGPGAVFPPADAPGKSAPAVVAKAPAVPVPAAAAAPAPTKDSAPPGGAAAISGSVTLAPSVAAQVKGNEHMFVFARAEGGPRVPLAVVRVKADALPYQFALDDSQAMAPGMNISSAQQIRIEARISRSGDVKAQPGDLFGTSDVVKPGTRGVKVLVDKVVP